MAKKVTKKSTVSAAKPSAKKATKPAKAAPTSKAKPVAKAIGNAKAAKKPVSALKARTVVSAASGASPVVEAKPAVAAKPGKNQAGLSVKDLQYFRELLLAKRRELLGDVSSMEDEALRNSGGTNLSNLPVHMADMGTDNYEQEFTLGLVEKDRVLLREINVALVKIQSGAYGICEGNGKPIAKPRLEAQPWTRYSIEWARKLEQRGGVRR